MATIVRCNCGAEYKRTETKFLVPHTGHASCKVCGARLEYWLESTQVPEFELVKGPNGKPAHIRGMAPAPPPPLTHEEFVSLRDCARTQRQTDPTRVHTGIVGRTSTNERRQAADCERRTTDNKLNGCFLLQRLGNCQFRRGLPGGYSGKVRRRHTDTTMHRTLVVSN